MADESVSAATVIDAPAAVIFAVLADPAKHVAIDGTGWVRESLDSQPLTDDWSAVPDSVREHLQFPPFPPDHLVNSLSHLARLAT